MRAQRRRTPREQWCDVLLPQSCCPDPGARLFQHRARLGRVAVGEQADLGVVHGALTVNGKLASVLYFDDIAMGMFVVVENSSTGETKYMRFTAIRPGSGKPN